MHTAARLALTGLPLATTGGVAGAQTLDVTVTIPRLNVAEYHRPYVAMWVEGAGVPPRTVAVWYDHDMRGNEGTTWLRDVRQWWRASGRSMRFPADGVTGATRPPGTHRASFTAGRAPLGPLAPGSYTLVVEAAREVGGRELVRLPFAWPPRPGATVRASGETELGAVTLGFRR